MYPQPRELEARVGDLAADPADFRMEMSFDRIDEMALFSIAVFV